ncbi:hypothetical protein IW245_000731 [Longispora fulva]|uniref:Uncharacterized protein n=1 Tax=Longispora fulva TaxID=619741 RepID=A0A8J7KUW7_9ACTN|nr:hypothetical protein [Longispora fulva]
MSDFGYGTSVKLDFPASTVDYGIGAERDNFGRVGLFLTVGDPDAQKRIQFTRISACR